MATVIYRYVYFLGCAVNDHALVWIKLELKPIQI